MSRKSIQAANFEATRKQLREQGERLRSEFVRRDLEAALTFLSLARFDLEKGETDHARTLLTHAVEAADTIARLTRQLSEAEADEMLGKLEAVRSQIAELQPK
jgi:hypothetical protein